MTLHIRNYSVWANAARQFTCNNHSSQCCNFQHFAFGVSVVSGGINIS